MLKIIQSNGSELAFYSDSKTRVNMLKYGHFIWPRMFAQVMCPSVEGADRMRVSRISQSVASAALSPFAATTQGLK